MDADCSGAGPAKGLALYRYLTLDGTVTAKLLGRRPSRWEGVGIIV